jgi:hypothetical protein
LLHFTALLALSSCSFLIIPKAPKSTDQRYAKSVVKNDRNLSRLGDHRCISWQGWEGDTIAVAVEAQVSRCFIGPPFLPLIPYKTGYGFNGSSVYDNEICSTDRLWLSVLVTIAPGHTITINACEAALTGINEHHHCTGMVRTDGNLDHAAFIPLPYDCSSPQLPMSWLNDGRVQQEFFLMLCFKPGLELRSGKTWTLKLPAAVNGQEIILEYHFRCGKWMVYSPISIVNG